LISVFLALAVLLSLAGAFLSFYVSAMPLIAGVLMMVMGAAMLVGKGFSHSPFVTLSGKKDGVIGTFGYGITYGFASTGCSAPVFYSLVFYSLASKSFSEGVVVFSAYALGIGLPLVVISVLVGLGRGALLHKFSKITPVLHRISGILLMSFGLYQICRYLLTQ
jgi:cytochrome c-type biogenesis protein